MNQKVMNFRVEEKHDVQIVVSDMIQKSPFYTWEIDSNVHFLYMTEEYWNDIDKRNFYLKIMLEKLRKAA